MPHSRSAPGGLPPEQRPTEPSADTVFPAISRALGTSMREAAAPWVPAPPLETPCALLPSPLLRPAEADQPFWGLGRADLQSDPPEEGLLAGEERPRLWLAQRVLPWRRLDGRVIWATDRVDDLGATISALGLERHEAFFVEVETPDLDRAFADRFAERLARIATDGLSVDHSVRGLDSLRGACAGALICVLSFAFFVGDVFAVVALGLLVVLNAGTGAMRLAALAAGLRTRPVPAPESDGAALPVVSVLIPLYREATMVEPLMEALARIDYPAARLDVKIVVEACDTATRVTLTREPLPRWCSVIVVPAGRPRTKPRALNYALSFCRGSVIGILDAEDCPAPGQLRAAVAALAAAPPDVGCVQCQLTYHNPRESWISRCFHLEYAIWFDVLLRGWERLGLPVPLGGTSVYFRREALVACGAWDAHNVTEDADLGMRLHRQGWRTRLIDSTTEEEANARMLPWIRQRSRWLKGYLLTWLSHMRRPARLWRELGPGGFLGFNILFLGGAASYLAMPLFWVAVMGWLLTGQGVWSRWIPEGALWPLYVSLAAGQAVMLACAAIAMHRRRARDLLLWVPTLPLYWTLGALAAWKAVAELFVAPTYWDKTRHGVSRLPRVLGRGARGRS